MQSINTLVFKQSNKQARAGIRVLSVLGLTALALSGCSFLPEIPEVPGMDRIVGEEGMFRDRKDEYLEAGSIAPTQIPAEYDSYIIDDLLVIPELGNSSAKAFPDPPRPMQIEKRNDREVVIQRMDDVSWIIADASPSQVWPKIRDYWREKGLAISVENPSAGIMETGWFTLDEKVLTKERIKIMVETGFQDNSAEIRLMHMSQPQALPELVRVNWPEESMDKEIAYDFLLELSSFLADSSSLYQTSTVSFLAGTISSEGKARLVTTSAGNQMLQLRADYRRSWAALRRALSRNEIEIIREDSGLGIIDLSFDPDKINLDEDFEDKKPGMLSRLFTLNGVFSKAEQEGNYRIRLQLLSTGDQVEILAVPFEGSEVDQETLSILMQLLKNTIA